MPFRLNLLWTRTCSSNNDSTIHPPPSPQMIKKSTIKLLNDIVNVRLLFKQIILIIEILANSNKSEWRRSLSLTAPQLFTSANNRESSSPEIQFKFKFYFLFYLYTQIFQINLRKFFSRVGNSGLTLHPFLLANFIYLFSYNINYNKSNIYPGLL